MGVRAEGAKRRGKGEGQRGGAKGRGNCHPSKNFGISCTLFGPQIPNDLDRENYITWQDNKKKQNFKIFSSSFPSDF